MSTALESSTTVSEKLRAIAKAIMADPEMYDQATYGNSPDFGEGWPILSLIDYFPDAGVGKCGTPGCVAGWAVALWGDKDKQYTETWDEEVFSEEFERYASELIFGEYYDPDGTKESEAIGRIFLPSWPDKWMEVNSNRIDLMVTHSYTWKPSPEQAVSVLRRLADQIEREGGIQV